MAQIENIEDTYYSSMVNYLDHLRSGGYDLLVTPPLSAVDLLVEGLFYDADLIQIAFMGGLFAWAMGIFVGQSLKYLGRLRV